MSTDDLATWTAPLQDVATRDQVFASLTELVPGATSDSKTMSIARSETAGALRGLGGGPPRRDHPLRHRRRSSKRLRGGPRTGAPPLGGFPNGLGYQITRCVEEPNRYIVRFEWDSLDGHLQGFRRGPEIREFFALVRPYVDAIEEMHHYQEAGISARG